MQSSHLNLQPRWQRREHKKVKAAHGRTAKAVIRMAPAPARGEFDPWPPAPRYQERLASACEALVAVYMSRHHEEGFARLLKGRHEGPLDHAIVRCQRAVRIRRMVQQDEDA